MCVCAGVGEGEVGVGWATVPDWRNSIWVHLSRRAASTSSHNVDTVYLAE